MDKDLVISRSFVIMLKKFISKNVIMLYTAVRRSVDVNKTINLIFKDTHFFECMSTVVISKRKEKLMTTSSSDTLKALSDVICNAKNWSENQ